MYKYYVYPDELYHHGVKGMKWGVRKQVQTTYNNAKTRVNKSLNKDTTISPKTKKKAIKIAGAVLLGAAGAYTVHSVYNSKAANKGYNFLVHKFKAADPIESGRAIRAMEKANVVFDVAKYATLGGIAGATGKRVYDVATDRDKKKR